MIRLAELAARRAVRIAKRFQNDLPHALRELGLVMCLRGKTTYAMRLLSQSMAVAERQGADYEFALSWHALSQIRSELDYADSPRVVPAAEAALRSFTKADYANAGEGDAARQTPTLSLADRFDTVLDSGRRIASALSPETIFVEVHRAAIQLLRAEKCIVMGVQQTHDQLQLTPLVGQIECEAIEVLVKRALRAGVAISNEDELAAEADFGEAAAQASSLCVPVLARGGDGRGRHR